MKKMKYTIVAIVVIGNSLVIYQQFNKKSSKKHVDQSKANTEVLAIQVEQLTPYSGTLFKVQNEAYNRFIFAKKTSTDYLLEMIKEYGELSGNEEFRMHSFWIAEIGDWHVIKVGNSVNFYTYHNLVGWITGYEENPDIPEYSIGFSKSKPDSKDDYIFYLDPNINAEDVEIGAFKNGKSFFVYLPDAYEPLGNLTVTNDFHVSLSETVEVLFKNGFDITTLESLEYAEHQIKINE
jgi:hypothetical protein